MSGLLLIAFLLFSAVLLCRAAQPIVMPQIDEVASSKSVFVDDPKFGKDPFFPKSARRKPAIVIPVTTTPGVSPLGLILNCVNLKGISGVPSKRLALLNNRTVGVGEETEIKCNNQAVKVRCLEIRAKSVLLGVDGSTETKEIYLRSGI